ncbi:hypothetical protein QNI23_005075 [Bermanella sp. WJH001]|uniref:hypothetical protein n=1 Tax=Bermanella sp. WJH001 TaxID=3048005 RepID=UPI0024BDC964|nr:hypothetical protein [Bermanella sp. WJH001]MDJ1539855.1 hypothetical protein [Bermanella sp. WJH001]
MFSFAQLQPLDDEALQRSHGFMGSHIQFEAKPMDKPLTLIKAPKTQAVAQYQGKSQLFDALTGLSKDGLSLTQGIEIDLDIQASLDMQWQDSDGLNTDGNGEAGSLTLSGLHLGSHKAGITQEMMNSDRPFLDSELAVINNLFIDFDSQQGMFITIEEIGDRFGNGLDIIVNDVYLGNEQASAGGLLIENLSNFIQDEDVNVMNQTFGLNLATLNDGKNTAGGNWLPINAIVLTEENQTQDTSVNLPNIDLGLPNITTTTTIDASFAIHIDKLAWVDDGGEFGIAGLMIYDGLDTNNDGIDDTIGPAKLTQMKIETIDHIAHDGAQVRALYIENLDFKADISMQSIYVGNPQTGSLGSLHIQGLDTAGTSVWIYGH